MLAQRVCRTASWLLIIICTPSFAGEIELAVGKVQEGRLTAGTQQSYVLHLNRGDYARIKVDARGRELAVITYDPSGGRFRATKLSPDHDSFDFIVDRPGAYRVDVVNNARIDAAFTILLEKVVSLEVRLTRPKPAYESPRIQALHSAIEAGKKESVDAFWKEVQKEGAPMIESLPGDKENMLVTFLWRGTPDTHNVFVARLPHAGAAPDNYFMNRLGQTDVWYKSVPIDRKARFEYSLAPNVPKLQPVSVGIDNEAIALIAAAARLDPLNPKRWRVDKQSLDPPAYNGRSIVEMPDAPAQPWIAERPGVPKGQIEKRRFKSALLRNEREIAIYLPPGYSRNDKPHALIVLFDEMAYLGDQDHFVLVPTPTILDNLIAAKRIPPMVAIFIDNVPGERDHELACNPAFSEFLSSELLPWARDLYSFTRDPSQTVIGGSSLGALAATCAALHHPQTFGNVLSQSGAYHRAPAKTSSDSEMDHEPYWIVKQFITSRKLPLRFYLDAGTEEFNPAFSGSILVGNQTLRDVLLAKGYEVHFQEFAGGHDYLSWRGTLSDGLLALMGTAAARSGQEARVKP